MGLHHVAVGAYVREAAPRLTRLGPVAGTAAGSRKHLLLLCLLPVALLAGVALLMQHPAHSQAHRVVPTTVKALPVAAESSSSTSSSTSTVAGGLSSSGVAMPLSAPRVTGEFSFVGSRPHGKSTFAQKVGT
jgi:hypothetical protein